MKEFFTNPSVRRQLSFFVVSRRCLTFDDDNVQEVFEESNEA